MTRIGLLLLILLLLLLNGCVSTRPAIDLARNGLVAGDQDAVDTFADRFFNQDAVIPANALMDDRLVSRNIVVRVEEPSRISQYGVDRVSDYFMCLLQIKHHVSSRDVLSDEILRNECGGECEPCNSLTYPLPEKARNRLRAYWLERQRQAP